MAKSRRKVTRNINVAAEDIITSGDDFIAAIKEGKRVVGTILGPNNKELVACTIRLAGLFIKNQMMNPLTGSPQGVLNLPAMDNEMLEASVEAVWDSYKHGSMHRLFIDSDNRYTQETSMAEADCRMIRL
jgi:hypothetical protein